MMEEILKELGLSDAAAVPFQNSEDGTDYQVWKITCRDASFVLKKAKGREAQIYAGFFAQPVPGVPGLHRTVRNGEDTWLLMEYVQGKDLCRCDREGLTKAMDALIRIQDRFWERRDLDGEGVPFDRVLMHRKTRGEYLKDPELEKAYNSYLEMFQTEKRTLCHDDLLPFNLIAGEDRAVILDWEVAGMLPYPTSLARLIAHGSQEENAFFYMTGADKVFAADYYYENLVKGKGIARADYMRSLNLCLLYEYCEWIMLGNRYPDTDRERFFSYLEKAKAHIKTL